MVTNDNAPEELKRILNVLVISTLTLLMTFAMFVPALAQEDLPDPGILPTSPLYGMKRGWERALDVITFDPESKSKLHQTYALTRLAEADAPASPVPTTMISSFLLFAGFTSF